MRGQAINRVNLIIVDEITMVKKKLWKLPVMR